VSDRFELRRLTTETTDFTEQINLGVLSALGG